VKSHHEARFQFFGRLRRREAAISSRGNLLQLQDEPQRKHRVIDVAAQFIGTFAAVVLGGWLWRD
jgi:hypothetical protein